MSTKGQIKRLKSVAKSTENQDSKQDSNRKEHKTIYTIGCYDWYSYEVLDALQEQGVEVLVDIRACPISRQRPYLSKEPWEGLVLERNIKYLYLGDKLSSRPRIKQNPQCYDEKGVALYSEIIKTKHFQEGLARLIKGVGTFTIALFGMFDDPLSCPRSLLICRCLRKLPNPILHFKKSRKGATLFSHTELEQRLLELTNTQDLKTAYEVQSYKVATVEKRIATPTDLDELLL